MDDKKQQTYKLKDVDVETVGLVSKGANRKPFFLTKSEDEEDNSMADELEVQETPVEELEDRVEVTEEQVEKGLVAFFAKLFKGGESVEEPKEEPVVTVIPEEIQKQIDAIPELIQTTKELSEKLEKAQKDLADANADVEKRTFLAKSDKLTSIGADRGELADFMVFLHKADSEKLEWFEGFVTGMNAKLAEAGIYEEIGKNDAPEQDDDPIQALIKSGEAEDIKDAYIKMGNDPELAAKYLRQRRTEVRTG